MDHERYLLGRTASFTGLKNLADVKGNGDTIHLDDQGERLMICYFVKAGVFLFKKAHLSGYWK